MTKWLKNSIYMVECKPLISVRPIPPPFFEGTNLKLSQITVHYKRLNWWLFFQNFNQFDYCETEKTHYISYLICKGTWMYIIWQSFSFQNYVFLTYFVRRNTRFSSVLLMLVSSCFFWHLKLNGINIDIIYFYVKWLRLQFKILTK